MSPSTNPPLITLDFDERRARFSSSNGVDVAAYDWGGDGPPLVLVHANGLHGHVWLPLARLLRRSFHCFGVDLRGQGDTGVGDPPAFAWNAVADDLAAALEGFGLHGRSDVYAVGHSMGACVTLMNEIRRPGTFAGIFGFEPVVFPRTGEHAVLAERGDNIVATMASKRREVFPSKQHAYDNYRSKPPFMTVDDAVLRAYVEWGFDDLDDGTVRLKCRAATESALFANSSTDTMERLGTVACPVLLGLSGQTMDGFKLAVPMQAKRMRNARLRVFDDRSHFGVLEGTSEMADIIEEAFSADRDERT